jgi:photosystem II stability/assembly factor-like uncharacterized protein
MKTLGKKFIVLFILIFTVTVVYTQSNQDFFCIKFLNMNTGMVTGQNGVIQKTTDMGQSWQDLSSGVTNKLVSSAQISESEFIVLGDGGTILKTTDGGITWIQKVSGVTADLKSIDIIEPGKYICCGDNGNILFTSDGGETWVIIDAGITTNLKQVQFIDINNGFIIGENSSFLMSNDGGHSWRISNTGFGNRTINSLSFSNILHGTVVGNDGLIQTTTDGGNTWYSDPTGLQYSGTFYKVNYYDNLNGAAVGDGRLLIRTTDGGSTWLDANQLENTGNSDLKCICFCDNMSGIAVGTNNKKLYTIDGGTTWYESFKASPKSKRYIVTPAITSRNYPNPFNPSTTINYQLSFDANVSIRVYDITGKEVAELLNGFQKSGSYNAVFNASNLSSGVYFYKIIAVNGNNKIDKTMRMILTK